MGCGSSKAAVAIMPTDSGVTKSVKDKDMVKEIPTVTENNTQVRTISVSSSTKSNSPILDTKSSKKNSIIQVRNAFEEELNDNNNIANKTLDDDVDSNEPYNNGSKTIISNSNPSIKSTKSSRGRSAGSMDSGVYDDGDRKTSGKSSGRSLPGSGRSGRSLPVLPPVGNNSEKSLRTGSGKPPSGKSSSARKKLLRINDDVDLNLESAQTTNGPIASDSHTDIRSSSPVDQSMTLRPKSRFGNLAFDIMLDTPETGNAKKKPGKLAPLPLNVKQKKKKKIKTKKDLDKKMEEAAARRQMHEDEKLLKAKQFQHFPVCTPVTAFHPVQDDDEDDHITSLKPINTTHQRLSNDNSATNVDLNKSFIIDTSYDDDRNPVNNPVNQTVVEPFRLDSDDDKDSFTENKFLDRSQPLATAVAC